jgi:O-6-methylguanine DNA methyltransferase
MSISDSPARSLRAIRAPHGFAHSILARAGLADSYVRTDSPLGEIFVAWNTRGISHVALAKSASAFEKAFERRFKRKAVATTQVPPEMQRALGGEMRAVRALKFDIAGLSSFAQSVLRKALQIPRGEVRPYSWIAAQIGSPKAVRAVGTALARNPVPLLIPCHRVVRTDGSIGDYALGSPNKSRILEREGVKIALSSRGLARVAL